MALLHPGDEPWPLDYWLCSFLHLHGMFRVMLHVSECMEDRTVSRFDPIHLFHTADFTDPLLAALGGDFNKVRTPVVTARRAVGGGWGGVTSTR